MSQYSVLDPSLLGTDIATNTSGDFAVVANDHDTISGVQNIINAFVRELTTPYGHLGRFILDCEGVKIIDDNYGNVAYYQFNENITPTWINEQLTCIEEVAVNHARIQLTQAIDYTILSGTSVQFNIHFQVVNYPQNFNLVLTRTGMNISAVLQGG